MKFHKVLKHYLVNKNYRKKMINLKIAIDFGHGVGSDRGAVGFIAEETIINSVGTLVVNKLNALGHTVIEVRPTSASSVGD